MDRQLTEIMENREENYMLPFFWMHDGHNGELRQLVGQVYDSGARALCVESRPHSQFCRQAWWDDMDVILDEASKRNMKVWILDDKHFPTGYANGLVTEKYPKLRKWQLLEEHFDVVGPAPGMSFLLEPMPEGERDEDEFIGVYAYEKRENSVTDTLEEKEETGSAYVDLTDRLRGRYVCWDVPKGAWRIFVLYKSRRGTGKKDYIHLIDPESVHVLIEAVYEPHYARYSRYFGNTLAGFFSDEPSLGNEIFRGENGPNGGGYDRKPGQPGLALPWTEQVLCRMSEELHRDAKPLLPALWYSMGEITPEVRVAYMNAVTTLWREAFSMQLGEWCRAHGVEYIGHIIEDMNAHARLGCSGGHYFRSLAGQDMAGIDVVLHQIMPGMAHYAHISCISGSGNMADPEFFDYTLARLAASHSHLEPRMRRRAMCEVFGAYGWAEGVPFMKHLLDHMLVRGINRFVPHAFSPDFPDPDCPPHFNAGGINPEFEAFTELMHYGNKTVHLLEGGREIVSAAILYHAEAEWSGRPCMLMQKPARCLYDAQLNYDFLPADTLLNDVRVEDGRLKTGDMSYPCLIVPYAAWLPAGLLDRLAELEREGLRLAFVDGRPEGCGFGACVPLSAVAAYVREAGGTDVYTEQPFDLLRMLHIRKETSDVFMFVNESMTDPYDGTVVLPLSGSGTQVELQLHRLTPVLADQGRLSLHLGCGQSCLFVFENEKNSVVPEGGPGGDRKAPRNPPRMQEIPAPQWLLSTRRADSPTFTTKKPLERFENLTGFNGDPDFSGWMLYETDILLDTPAIGLDLGLVGECAKVTVNGISYPWLMDAPYQVLTGDSFRPGLNHIEILVANTLVHMIPDYFSHYTPITPSGLLGPVRLLF